MVGDAVQAGSFKIDLTYPIPRAAYVANKANAKTRGSWPIPQR
jgi:hypothetical protein